MDVRLQQAAFAASFQALKPLFISEKHTDISSFLQKKKVESIALSLKHLYTFDPFSFFLGHHSHQSWLAFNQKQLERVIPGIDYAEIYEPYFFYSAQVAQTAHNFNKKVITEVWTSFASHPARFIPPYSWNTKTVIKNTDLFLARTKRAAIYIRSLGVQRKKIVQVYPGIDTTLFAPHKKPKKGISILFVGALAAHKGLDDILAVFPEIIKQFPLVTLTICGKGPMEKEVREKAKKLPITFLGQVPYSELPSIYNQADIFCGPSKTYANFGVKRWEEYLGYTFLEAMASGLPIVTTKCGAIPEIVGPENICITQGNRGELSRALITLLQDADRRLKIGRCNRKRAGNRFALKKQTKVTEQIILKAFSV